MNSIVSGTAIEPLIQRMANVQGVQVDDEESSRDQGDDEDEEEEGERDEEEDDDVDDVEVVDPSDEKPEEEQLHAVAGPVVSAGVDSENSNSGSGAASDSEAGHHSVQAVQVPSESMAVDAEHRAVSEPVQVIASDNGSASGRSVDSVAAVAQSVADRMFEQAQAEIARIQGAMDEFSSRVRDMTSSSASGGGGGGAVRRRNTPQSVSSSSMGASLRYRPFQVPQGHQQQQQQRMMSRQPPQQQQQQQQQLSVALQPQQGSGSQSAQPPPQVIRSAIVGNRTIITTKTPSKFPFSAELKQGRAAILGDRYILLDLCDGTSLYKCIDIKTKEEFVCKIANNPCTSLLEAHFRLESHPHINPFRKVIHGAQHTYLLFEPSQGDLHSYVRIRKRLRETEAKRLFRQMCETVKACHDQGIVLRDLKLRKFIFADEEKTQLRLESLEDAVVLEDPRDDLLQDKRGCPAYVSPEILKANTTYSGKAADMWSLGVILYTMLVGRYPFNDSEHASLFAKISRGHFHVPECLSSKARCVIRALLRKHPEERITSEDLLHHPWLTKENFRESVRSCSDQMVPMGVPKRRRNAQQQQQREQQQEQEDDQGEMMLIEGDDLMEDEDEVDEEDEAVAVPVNPATMSTSTTAAASVVSGRQSSLVAAADHGSFINWLQG